MASSKTFKYLSQEQVDHYFQQGYLVVRNLLTEKQLCDCKEAIRFFKEKASITDKDLEFSNEGLLERVRFPSQKHEAFARLIKAENLLDCLEDLLGDSIRYVPQDKLNCKPARGGAAIRWHQDWAHFPHTNGSVLTACVLFDDATKENGCLQVIPESHKGPLYSHHANGQFVGLISDPEFKPCNIKYLEAPAGSVTIHHARTVHGSAKNLSESNRVTSCFVYTAMDAWPLLGVGDDSFACHGPVDFEAFTRTMVRGSSTLSPRMELNPVLLPAPFTLNVSVLYEAKILTPEPE